jgi:hypothetical protein
LTEKTCSSSYAKTNFGRSIRRENQVANRTRIVCKSCKGAISACNFVEPKLGSSIEVCPLVRVSRAQNTMPSLEDFVGVYTTHGKSVSTT